jgi:hypothetical protein
MKREDKIKATTIKHRNRVVHGWAFRDHTDEEIVGIRKYLETGDTSELPERYKNQLFLDKE